MIALSLQIVSDDPTPLGAEQQKAPPVEHRWAQTPVAVMRARHEIDVRREPPRDLARPRALAHCPGCGQDALVLPVHQQDVVPPRAAEVDMPGYGARIGRGAAVRQ